MKTINEPTVSGNQHLSNKIITLYLCVWIHILYLSFPASQVYNI